MTVILIKKTISIACKESISIRETKVALQKMASNLRLPTAVKRGSRQFSEENLCIYFLLLWVAQKKDAQPWSLQSLKAIPKYLRMAVLRKCDEKIH
jgi:hypothetical protein